MNKDRQIQKAHDFRALHHEPKLLVLPNVWDVLGARMLESLGYPAVATASAAVAFSMGYDDGEKITFAAMLEAVRRVADSVSVPVTADIERGYAEDLNQLRDNIRRVIATGSSKQPMAALCCSMRSVRSLARSSQNCCACCRMVSFIGSAILVIQSPSTFASLRRRTAICRMLFGMGSSGRISTID